MVYVLQIVNSCPRAALKRLICILNIEPDIGNELVLALGRPQLSGLNSSLLVLDLGSENNSVLEDERGAIGLPQVKVLLQRRKLQVVRVHQLVVGLCFLAVVVGELVRGGNRGAEGLGRQVEDGEEEEVPSNKFSFHIDFTVPIFYN